MQCKACGEYAHVHASTCCLKQGCMLLKTMHWCCLHVNGCVAQECSLSEHHGVTGVATDATALLEQQLAAKDAQIAKLAGTLQHYRNWAMQVR